MVCTFFGHKDTPETAELILWSTLIDLIENHAVTFFYVGNNGNFDVMVRRQLEALSHNYAIAYSVVLSYIPSKRNENFDFSNTVLPEGIETVPKRFALSWRNKWMIQKSDIVVTYVTHTYGGAWKFKVMAEKAGKQVREISS